MKRLTITLALALLLTSCGESNSRNVTSPVTGDVQPQSTISSSAVAREEDEQPIKPEPIAGEVVSCSEVKFHQKPEKDLILNCLDGAQGFNVGAIQGPAIINVWGSWCPPCVREIPIFVDFYATRDPSIQLVGVDFQDGPLFAVKPYIVKAGITWPNFADQEGLARGFFGNSVPVTWFIDSDNKVAYKKYGPVESLAELRKLSQTYIGLS